MEAIRRIEQVKGNQVTVTLPDRFRGKRVEVIVLSVEDVPAEAKVQRRPAPELVGTRILDDLVAPAIPMEEWDSLK